MMDYPYSDDQQIPSLKGARWGLHILCSYHRQTVEIRCLMNPRFGERSYFQRVTAQTPMRTHLDVDCQMIEAAGQIIVEEMQTVTP